MAAYFADFATLMQRLGPDTYGGVDRVRRHGRGAGGA